MAYGVLVQADDATLQIDSNNPYSYLKVVANTSATTATVATNQLLFIKPTTLNTIYGANIVGTTYTFKNNSFTTVTLSYIICESSKNAAAIASGYGLQIYNSDSQLCFDSNIFTSTAVAVQIVKIIPFGSPTVSGNSSLSSSIVYTGADYASVYACLVNSYFQSSTIYINGFKWNSADTTIRFVSVNGAAFWNAGAAIILCKII